MPRPLPLRLPGKQSINDSRVFLDTNIFLYTALGDEFQQERRTAAVNLLKGLNDKLVYVNTQVLNPGSGDG
jgi:predicted nucleic acid-binding protein